MNDIFFVTILVTTLVVFLGIMIFLSSNSIKNKYVGPFPRTVKARKAYGFEIVDAEIVGVRKRWFMPRYLVEYRHRSEFSYRTFYVIRHIRGSQIVEN